MIESIDLAVSNLHPLAEMELFFLESSVHPWTHTLPGRLPVYGRQTSLPA